MLTDAQKEARKNGLGGTDVAAIMGLSPYKTPYELWLEKTGVIEPQTILTEDRLRLRHAHEETIAREYAFRNNCKLRRVNKTLYHKKYSFMLCHLDRIVLGAHKILECKSSSAFMKQHFGDAGTDQIFPHYVIQVQHQMAITGFDLTDVAALIDIDDYREYPIQRDNDIIKVIEDACDKFWNFYVKEKVPPDLTCINDYKLAYPINNGTFVQATNDIVKSLDEMSRTKWEMRSQEIHYNEELERVFAFIGEADGIKDGDKILATWRADKNGTRRFRIVKQEACK